MKVIRNQRNIVVERDEKDSPMVEEPYPRPFNVSSKEFNSWRKTYRIIFDTEAEAKKAEAKILTLKDFDTAAAWLDKQ